MPRNFSDALKSTQPLKIFGTLPIFYDKNQRQFKPQFLRGQYLASLFLMFTLMVSAVVYLIAENTNNREIKFWVKLFKVGVTMRLLTVTYRSRRQLADCLNKTQEYDIQVRDFGFTLSYKFLRMLSRGKKALISVTFLLANLTCAFMTRYSDCAVFCITHNVTYVISSIILTEFCGFIVTIRQHIAGLNRYIRRLTPKCCDAISGLNRDIRRLDPKRGDSISAAILKKIMVHHGKICRLGGRVNDAFAAQLLMIISRTLIEFFNSLHSWVGTESGLAKIYDLSWSALAIGEFAFMVTVCKRATDEYVRTGHLLNMLPVQDNQRLEVERNLFLLQLKHKKLVFTANGMYNIDNKMFLRLITSTVAYLVIIIQFEK